MRKTTDHLGNEFTSISDMCRTYGIPTSTFDNRINNMHMSLKDALTIKPHNHEGNGITCKDHLGNEFDSISKMCKHWKIDRQTYYGRLSLNWSLEKILTTPLDYKGGAAHVFDHTGKEFLCVSDMCKAWNMPRTTYNQRIKAGWSIKDALTKPIKKIRIKKTKSYDHLGNEFESFNAMCRHYGTTKDIVNGRMRKGWTLQECLEHPDKIDSKKPQTDHEGNTFDSLSDMLKYWNVNETTYRTRIKNGESMKDALTKSNRNFRECFDHNGMKFSSIDDMCRYYHVSKSNYYSRIEKGWSLERVLTTFIPGQTLSQNLVIRKQLNKNYYIVLYQNHEDVWSHDEILQKLHETERIEA